MFKNQNKVEPLKKQKKKNYQPKNIAIYFRLYIMTRT